MGGGDRREERNKNVKTRRRINCDELREEERLEKRVWGDTHG